MNTSPAKMVTGELNKIHALILKFLKKLSDDELHLNLSSGSHSIAWHAWHVTRWADHLQASIPGMTPELGRRLGTGAQIWHKDRLVDHWGFKADELGWGETGMLMSDEAATKLVFPAKDALLNYVEHVFQAIERAVSAIDDEQFVNMEQLQPMTEGIWGEATVGDAILAHVTHANRHLGMMECLLGLQGKAGTATR
ncbi:MAG: DinB family protein [Anaerolineae bacterium]|nr:DinB family protein [Anaerolineae bacterium]